MRTLTNIKKEEMEDISEKIETGSNIGETLAAAKATPYEKFSELVDNSIAAADSLSIKAKIEIIVYELSDGSYYIVSIDKSGGFNKETFSKRVSKLGNDISLGKENSLHRYNIGIFNALFGLGECKILLSHKTTNNAIWSDGFKGNIFSCCKLTSEIEMIPVEVEGKIFKHEVPKDGTLIGIYCSNKENPGSLFKHSKMETSLTHLINDFKVRYSDRLDAKSLEATFKLVKLDGSKTKTIVKESFKTVFDGKVFEMTLEEEGVKATIKMALLASDKTLEEKFGKDCSQLSSSKKFHPFKIGLVRKNAKISQNGKMLFLANAATLFKKKNGEEKGIHPDFNNVWIDINAEGLVSFNTKNGIDKSHKSYKILLKLIQDFLKKSGFGEILKSQSKNVLSDTAAHDIMVNKVFEKINHPFAKKEVQVNTQCESKIDILVPGIIYELKTKSSLKYDFIKTLKAYLFDFTQALKTKDYTDGLENFGKLKEYTFIFSERPEITPDRMKELNYVARCYKININIKTFKDFGVDEYFSTLKIKG